MLINVKMPTIFCWHFNIYEQDKFHSQLRLISMEKVLSPRDLVGNSKDMFSHNVTPLFFCFALMILFCSCGFILCIWFYFSLPGGNYQ